MTEEDAFLLDLLARPDDEAARLIYADWLTDSDDPRAELVRRSYLLRSARASDPAHAAFAREWASAREANGWQEYDGLLLTWDQMVTVFRFRLAEVIAHCGGDLTPLRTWELEPRTLIGRSSGGWPPGDHPDWPLLDQELAAARRRVLERAGRAPSRLPTHLAGGRLVVFTPSLPLFDQGAHTGSNGYFDTCNVPPWDSWVLFLDAAPEGESGQGRERYLLAWVPQGRLHFAGVGIGRATPEGVLAWAHETSTPFLRRLRRAGISGV